MRLTGTRSVSSPRQLVWDTLQNPDELAACMPGCEGMTPIGPDEYSATMTVKIAAIGGSFQGKVALVQKQEPASFIMRVVLRASRISESIKVRGEIILLDEVSHLGG